jgi:hypothetical protein
MGVMNLAVMVTVGLVIALERKLISAGGFPER